MKNKLLVKVHNRKVKVNLHLLMMITRVNLIELMNC